MLGGTVLLSLNLQLFVTPILFILVDISVSSPQINRVLVCAKWKFTHEVTLWIESLSFTYTANGKCQIQFENFSKQKNEQIKTAPDNSYGLKNCVKLLIYV